MASKRPKWQPWRGPEVTGSGNDLSGVNSLDLIDITLVTEVSGEANQVGNLGLAFAERGMTVRRGDGSELVTIPWTAIVELSAEVQPRQYAALSTGVSLEVKSDRRRHRFVVPNVTPEALTSSLRAISTRYGRGELLAPAARGKRKDR